MIELNEQQRQELSGPEPRAVDPQTNRTYVLISEEVYQRIKGLIDEEWDDDTLRAQLARSAEANGWNEPNMDENDRYDGVRPKR
jgi:hypothetical protein